MMMIANKMYTVFQKKTSPILLLRYLLVINCTGGRILHSFLRHVHRRYIWLPLAFYPWDDLRKLLHDGQGMAKLQNGVETFSKILIG